MKRKMVMNELKGSCLCGAIRYASDSLPLFTAVCHCAACQKSMHRQGTEK